MSKWSNAGSFSSGFADGLRMVGSLYDLKDRREDRQRKLALAEAKENREQGRYGTYLQQAADLHDARQRATDEYDDNAEVRGLKRTDAIEKLKRAHEIMNDPKRRALEDDASLAALQDIITKSKENSLGLKLANETYDDKVKKARMEAKGKSPKEGTPRYTDADGLSYTMKDLTNLYKEYVARTDEPLSFKEYVADLLGRKKKATGITPTKEDPLTIDLSRFETKLPIAP